MNVSSQKILTFNFFKFFEVFLRLRVTQKRFAVAILDFFSSFRSLDWLAKDFVQFLLIVLVDMYDQHRESFIGHTGKLLKLFKSCFFARSRDETRTKLCRMLTYLHDLHP